MGKDHTIYERHDGDWDLAKSLAKRMGLSSVSELIFKLVRDKNRKYRS